ncbi:2,4-dienoyl-CoA reductase [Nymphon striatum]|nr:2,4-dienoyl-CoA reductase [Nymphon striatum]
MGVTVKLNTEVSANDLNDFDEVIIATGVVPRDPQIPGQNADNVVSYIDVLNGTAKVGQKVAVIGAGGIGFDVSEHLVQEGESTTLNLPEWMKEWGVADPSEHRAGLAPEGPPAPQSGPRGDDVAAQDHQGRQRPGQDHGLDSPCILGHERGQNDCRRQL